MSDYTLYYWSAPFRGQFVRAVLAFAGKKWTEGGDGAISKLMGEEVGDMPVPFMGPPLLIDKKKDFAIAQMPAIVLYLGETLDLMPATPALRAMTMKIVLRRQRRDRRDHAGRRPRDVDGETLARIRSPLEKMDVVLGRRPEAATALKKRPASCSAERRRASPMS